MNIFFVKRSNYPYCHPLPPTVDYSPPLSDHRRLPSSADELSPSATGPPPSTTGCHSSPSNHYPSPSERRKPLPFTTGLSLFAIRPPPSTVGRLHLLPNRRPLTRIFLKMCKIFFGVQFIYQIL